MSGTTSSHTLIKAPIKSSSFISEIEKLLEQDLQVKDTFGCRIKDCHIKIGSKQHFEVFTEAELLFHDSYYNKHFAQLTADKIFEIIEESTEEKIRKILLIGHETFSELLVCETVILLEDKKNNEKKPIFDRVEYGIYNDEETEGSHFRYSTPKFNANLNEEDEIQEFWEKELTDFQLVFIVPINTTLTTHDKIITRFYEDHKIKLDNPILEDPINIGLIIIGSKEENDFWELDHPNINALRLKGDKQRQLLRLKESLVWFFAKIDVKWHDVKKCPLCYPDVNLKDGKLIDERATFSLNRKSSVPMLQLPSHKESIMDNEEVEAKSKINLKRVHYLCESLHHGHINRRGNHYQYYFNLVDYYNREKNNISLWLSEIKKNLIDEKKSIQNKRLYNYFRGEVCHDSIKISHIIVSPRHFSNAQFIQRVNDKVFSGSARIIYFDAKSEFRSNATTKYSNISTLIDEAESDQKTAFLFHFVDDTINSGEIIRRYKSLMQSIVGEKKSDNCYIDIFTSVIVLLSRISEETKCGYVEETSRFLEYVHLAISPLRSFDDTCPVCKVKSDYRLIKERYAATTDVVKNCDRFIDYHEEDKISSTPPKYRDRGGGKKKAKEYKYRVIYSHLLNELLARRLYVKMEEQSKVHFAINSDNTKDILNCIKLFYNGSNICSEENGIRMTFSVIKYSELLDLPSKAANVTLDMKVALIKIISRPFFFYQLRFRQAAFEFCINELDTLLNSEDHNKDHRVLCKTLMNALADMHANYLLRTKTMNKLWNIASQDKDMFTRKDLFYAVKHVTALSGDNQKSLLLEYVLVEGNEQNFFNDRGKWDETLNIPFEDKVALYLENTAVLKNSIEDFLREKNSVVTDANCSSYHLDEFKEFFSINDQPFKLFLEANSSNDNCSLRERLREIKKILDDNFKKDSNRAQTKVKFKALCKHINKYFEHLNIYKKATVFFVNLDYFPKEPNDNPDLWAQYRCWEKYYTYPENNHLCDFTEQDIHPIEGIDLVMKESTKDEIRNTGSKTLFFNRKKEHIVLKICGNTVELGKREFILIYLKPSQAIEGVKDLFYIRLLLTLRNDIAKMIDQISIQTLLEEKINERVRQALSFEKAASHISGRSSAFAASEIGRARQLETKYSIFYFLATADAMISKMYRFFAKNNSLIDIEISNEDDMNAKGPVYIIEQSIMRDPSDTQFKDLMNQFGFVKNEKKTAYTLTFETINKNEIPNINVTINIKASSFAGADIKFIAYQNELDPVMLTILLLADNAAKHRENVTRCEVEVEYSSEDGLIISNKCYDANDTPMSVVSDIKEAKQKCLKPPWAYGNGKESITLWTLDKIIRYISQDHSENGGLVIQSKNNEFIVKLKLKRKE